MLKVQEIRELIKLIDQSNVDEFLYEHAGSKIEMKKNKERGEGSLANIEVAETQPTPKQVKYEAPEEVVQPEVKEKQAQPETIEQENLHKITSPMVGTFYAAPSPDDSDFVKVGDKITTDSVVCIVEAMKLFNEIEAEVKGEVVEILVENGQLVEYGQPMFLVKPE